MAQPRFLKFNESQLIAEWPSFERWSASLTSAEVANTGLRTFTINQAGGLQGDPVLTLPSIPNDYKRLVLEISAKCAIQATSGAFSYGLTANNYGCGYAGADGIIVDGVINQFSFSGENGKLNLTEMPERIDFSSLALSFLLDSSYNLASWPIGAGSQYLAMRFNVSMYGAN